jgi:hypothetical protein
MLTAPELRVMELAARQSGYATRRQAIACGMQADAIDRRVKSKRWSRVKPGLYLVSGYSPSIRGLLVAATATLGAVVSHESAAELHDLPGTTCGLAVVTVNVRKTYRFPDVKVHQLTDLTDDQIVEVEALPVTSAVRTAIDLAVRMGPFSIGRIVDHIVLKGQGSLDEVGDLVLKLARHGKPGMKCLHKVLEVRAGGSFLGESQLEVMALRLFREWGFPDPVPQLSLPWRSPVNGRVDFAYPWVRLIIELDGRAWHSTLEAFESDRMRDNHAQLAGWRVLRITYRMLRGQPEMVRDMIRQILDTAA